MSDAVDALIVYHTGLLKDPPPELLWAGFVDMWGRIGEHCRVDFLVWAGGQGSLFYGESPHTWNDPGPKFRAEAKEWLDGVMKT